MVQVVMNMGKVNPFMEMEFCLFIKQDWDPKRKRADIIEKKSSKGVDYVNIRPHPYLNITISNPLGKESTIRNPHHSIALTTPFIYHMLRGIEEVQKAFKIKDLYYYTEDKKLKLDSVLAQKATKFIRLPTKSVCITPTVIQSKEMQGIEYEGVMFMINSVNNFCCLTITDLDYLRFRLTNIDLYAMSLQVLSLKVVSDILERKDFHTLPDIAIKVNP